MSQRVFTEHSAGLGCRQSSNKRSTGQQLTQRGACRYVVYFKCNRQFIHQYPNLSRLTRDVYHTPGKQRCWLDPKS